MGMLDKNRAVDILWVFLVCLTISISLSTAQGDSDSNDGSDVDSADEFRDQDIRYRSETVSVA